MIAVAFLRVCGPIKGDAKGPMLLPLLAFCSYELLVSEEHTQAGGKLKGPLL